MVDKAALEFILSDQKEEIEARTKERLCHRKEESQVDLDSPQAQVIIGVRRSGKSTLCYQSLRAKGVKFAYANFDDERLEELKADQLNDVLEVLYKIYGDFSFLFLDEIQNVEGWHLFVNRLLRKRIHVVVTGSNARLLSSELATHLSGRKKEIELFPFSFLEFCEVQNVDAVTKTTKAEAFRRDAFDQYQRSGGFPELQSIKDSRHYIAELVNDIVQRDIEQRYSISYKVAFENMTHHLLNNVPCVVVPKDLARQFGFRSEHTARNYISYLKSAYLLIGIQKYSTKSRIRLTQEKVYAVDVAMMDKRENAFAGANLGHRLETIVLVHLIRKSRAEALDVYYLNDRSGECNFVVCDGNKLCQAIQVSYDISAETARKREIRGLLLAERQTGCTDLLLLTHHNREDIEVSGCLIRIRPVYEWCLELGI